MKIYLDNNGWDALFDHSERGGNISASHEYLFSSCNLDEFGLAPRERRRDLAAFALKVSNGKKLLDHIEFTIAELMMYQSGSASIVCPYDEKDSGFHMGWRMLAANGLPENLVESASAEFEREKSAMREWTRASRELFRPGIGRSGKGYVEDNWPTVLSEMYEDGQVNFFLKRQLEQEGMLDLLPDPEGIASVPIEQLPATSCWIEYYLALLFLTSYGSGKSGKPDRGDQVDFRHACYAGVADVFVTGDLRMAKILSEMVPSRRSKLLDREEFIELHSVDIETPPADLPARADRSGYVSPTNEGKRQEAEADDSAGEHVVLREVDTTPIWYRLLSHRWTKEWLLLILVGLVYYSYLQLSVELRWNVPPGEVRLYEIEGEEGEYLGITFLPGARLVQIYENSTGEECYQIGGFRAVKGKSIVGDLYYLSNGPYLERIRVAVTGTVPFTFQYVGSKRLGDVGACDTLAPLGVTTNAILELGSTGILINGMEFQEGPATLDEWDSVWVEIQDYQGGTTWP
jgi:hypothetical protein